MEALLILLFGLYFIGGPILLLIVFARLSSVQTELERLRSEQRSLRVSISARTSRPATAAAARPTVADEAPIADQLPAPVEAPVTAPVKAHSTSAIRANDAPEVDSQAAAARTTPAPPTRAASHPEPADPSRASVGPRARAALDVDWERWLGIRGAAVVGGIALIFAGLFFVQVAIERGWLGPTARDVLAFGIGVVALGSQRPLRRRGLVTLGDSIGGAGTVLMYGAAWAAARLHDIVPIAVALTVMTGVTMTALVLAARTRAPILAAFAIVGGFATPILLDTLGGSAAALFGYIVVLDLCLLTLGRLRSWRAVAPAALVGTTLIQWAWIETHGWSTDPWFFVVMLGSFTGLFCASVAREAGPARRSDPVHVATLLASLGLPFLFLVRGGAELGTTGPIWPVVVLSVVLCSGAAWLGRTSSMTASPRGRRWTSPASLYFATAAAGSLVTLAWWTIRRHLGAPDAADSAWAHWALSSAGLGLLLVGLARTARERLVPFTFALLSVLAAHPLTLSRRADAGAVGPESSAAHGEVIWGMDLHTAFVAAIAALAGLAVFAGSRTPWPRLTGGATGLAAGFALTFRYDTVHGKGLSLDDPLLWAAVALGVVFSAVGLSLTELRPHRARRARAWTAAGLFVALPMLLSTAERSATDATLVYAAMLVVAVAVALAAQRVPGPGPGTSSVLAVVSVGLGAALVELTWSQSVLRRDTEFDVLRVGFAALAMVAALPLTTAATATGRRTSGSVARSSIAWLSSVPAAALAFGPSRVAESLGERAEIGPLGAEHVVLLAGAVILAAAGQLLSRRTEDRLAASAHLALASGLAGVAAARLFAEQWTTVAAAIAAGSWAALAGRAGSPQQRTLATGIAVLAAAVLLAMTFIARAFAVEDFFLPLQLTIDYGMVLAALCLAATAHRAVDPEQGRSAGKIAITASALAVTFGWMNAAVLNRFATGESIAVDLARIQARELTLSVAWAVFASALLAVGLARKNPGLRWTSLALFVTTIFKVFLYDLGTLSGLPRVGSFFGLAVALMGVSLVYARVLGHEDEQPPPPGDTLPDDDVDTLGSEPLP